MAVKTQTAIYHIPGARSVLLREILGIVLGMLSLLIFFALASAWHGAQWIGHYGDWIAKDCLFLVFGHYVSFCLPVMLFVMAYHAMRGVSSTAVRGHGWLRGLGGLLILISSCALLALLAPGEGQDRINRAFELGGTVGAMLISKDGVNLSLLMGRMGATILLGGLSLIGVVIFTETMLRDLARMLWGSTQRVVQAGMELPRGRGVFGLGKNSGGDRDGRHEPVSRPPVRPASNPSAFSRMEPELARPRRRWYLPLAGLTCPRPLRWIGAPFVWIAGLIAEFQPWETLIEALKLILPLRRRAVGQEAQATPKTPAAASSGRTGSIFRRAAAEELPEAGEDDLDESPLDDDGNGSQTAYERRARRSGTGEYHSAALMAEELHCEPGEGTAAEELGSIMLEPALARRRAGRAGEAGDSRRDPRVTPVEQSEIDLFPREFILPPLGLLTDPPSTIYQMSEDEKNTLSRKIEQTLAQFKVEVEVFEVIQGPVITRFALRVAPGVRVNKILALESELTMALKAQHVRILAPIPGQSAVGIEVPNKRSNPVVLRELLDTDTFRVHKSPLAFALGKNIAGETVVCDLAAMPHLLIAGATGSGKSVCLNTIIASLLYRNKPDKVKFVMVDPKRVELSIYQAIPHLLSPVVSETKKAAAALAWCVEQMETRYKLLAELGMRNLDGYNGLVSSKEPQKKLMGRRDLKVLPHIVIIIDELADLMMVAKAEVEEYIIRLAQMARAVGIHLILATQRPSVNVITGIIKANFPSRIAFQVSSKVDSRTILDQNGAEALMGKGDMLYSPGGSKPFRIQGAFVSDAEVERLADYIREQEKVRYEKEDFELKPTPAERAKAQLQVDEDGHRRIHSDDEDGLDEDGANTIELPGLAIAGRAGNVPLAPGDADQLSDEELYDMALRLVLESRKASVSYIQRRMKIGYARAGRIMDMMEENGIVGPYQGSKPRDLLVNPADFLQKPELEEE